jgi:hypothetical protein
VQQGTHRTLLEQDGLYRDFCLLQLGHQGGVTAPAADRTGGDSQPEAILAMAVGSSS